MSKSTSLLAAGFALVAGAAFAQDEMPAPTGDVAAGETAFGRQCVACHVVVNEAGETLAGRNAQTGPNLFGIAGGPIGAQEGFRYSEGLAELGEAGEIWSEEYFAGYVQDPTAWIRETLENPRARGLMSFRVRKEQDALDIYAYLHSLSAE